MGRLPTPLQPLSPTCHTAQTVGRIYLIIAAVAGFSAVATGAFAAHALQRLLTPAQLAILQTGVLYHHVHALALGLAALLSLRSPSPQASAAGACFIAGLLLFSGSLYALALTGYRPLGMLTPLGGLAFLAGWACLGWAAWTG